MTTLKALFVLFVIVPALSKLSDLSCEYDEYQWKLGFASSRPGINAHCIESVTGIIKYEPEEFILDLTEILRYFCFICDDTCMPFVSDLIHHCIPKLIPLLKLACASNGNYLCWSVPYFDNGSLAHAVCYNNIDTENLCPTGCKGELLRLYEHGCCVHNIFDTALFGSAFLKLGVGNEVLWNNCQLKPVGPCPVPELLKGYSESLTITTNNPIQLKSFASNREMFVVSLMLNLIVMNYNLL